MKVRHILFFFFFYFISGIEGYACTSMIVSGKASADGRPFIFKNRDTNYKDQTVVIYKGEKYHYTAIADITNGVVRPNRVGSGFNEAGFSIINTVANNLNGGKKDISNNSKVLRRALEVCATLEDFENLLDTLPKPLHIDSNYGVMDAQGGVAYYEAGNKGYVKYDANDPKIAPNGYLIRTNFGVSGNKIFGKGYGRYTAMEMYIDRIKKNGKIGFEDVIRGATRFLTHGETKVNLYNYEPENDKKPVFVDFKDFIPRSVTVSAQLIQGVKKGESPQETTAWTMCGFPLTTVCIPIWLTKDNKLPKIVSRSSNGHSVICDAGLTLKKRLFPNNKKRKKNEINLAQLINKSGTGIQQQIKPIEDNVFLRARDVQTSIRKEGTENQKVTEFYSWVDQFVASEYEKRFGIRFDSPQIQKLDRQFRN